jgi:hypothetical protein
MLRNDIYYNLKPLIPRALRWALRRQLAARTQRRVSDVWPIKESAGRKPEDWSGWPEGKQFALVLTHDVESQVGLDRVRQLAELEMRLGFRSSFNFIPEGPYQVSKELLEWLVSNGFEVGVHDLQHDGKLYRSRAEFVQKAMRINHYVKEWSAAGFRSGFMLNKLDWLHELNVQYDASTFDTDPFEPQPEGRHTIFPFWVSRPVTLNPENVGTSSQRSMPNGSDNGYVELPYTLPQDSTLFLLLRERNADIWERKLDWIAEHGGMALVIVHPDYMSFDNKSHVSNYPAALYSEFLAWARNKYADTYWSAMPAEVAEFVRPLWCQKQVYTDPS